VRGKTTKRKKKERKREKENERNHLRNLLMRQSTNPSFASNTYRKRNDRGSAFSTDRHKDERERERVGNILLETIN